MKRYLFVLCAMVIILIALSACDQIQRTDNLATAPVSAYMINAGYDYIEDAILVDDATPVEDADTDAMLRQNPEDEAEAEAISWQEAYSDKLRYYAQLPAVIADQREAQWRFMLHDIDQDGIPELFLVMVYEDGNVDHRAVYSFDDGGIIRLKSAISGEINGGMFAPPDGGSGVILMRYVGFVTFYVKLDVSGNVLSNVLGGDFSKTANAFRINAHPVTEDEFGDIFGRRDDSVSLALHDINEGNIRNIIFGWQDYQ